MSESPIQNNVMLRVKSIHRMRQVIHPFKLKILFFVVGFLATAFMVSIPNVIANMLHALSPAGYVNYLLAAFIHTNISVQIILSITVFAFVLMLRDFGRTIKGVLYYKAG